MPTPILLTGGTGTLGRVIVPRLRDTGCYLRVLSRNVHQSTETIEYVTGDLATDQGIRPAVEGVDVIVHMAGGPKGDDEATRNLVRAAAAARVRHIVYISVIGADRVPLGYFRAKHGAEQAVADSGVPWTTLRAAQFHDLILTMLQAMVKQASSSDVRTNFATLDGLLLAAGDTVIVDTNQVDMIDFLFTIRNVRPNDLVSLRTNGGEYNSDQRNGQSVELLNAESLAMFEAAANDNMAQFILNHPDFLDSD
jgi:NAD(P)-dependent dehydrogenase (short-subunit alcohol dehydrogenase family)